MTLFKLVFALLSLIAVILTFRTNNKITNFIVAGMIAGIILVQFPSGDLTVAGIVVYMIFAAAGFIYGLLAKGKSPYARMIISVLSSAMFTYWLWLLNHWHGNTALLPILAILAGIAGIFRMKELKPEWGFLLILFIDALDSIVENLLKAF